MKVEIYGKPLCSSCQDIADTAKRKGATVHTYDYDEWYEQCLSIMAMLRVQDGVYPVVVIDGKCLPKHEAEGILNAD